MILKTVQKKRKTHLSCFLKNCTSVEKFKSKCAERIELDYNCLEIPSEIDMTIITSAVQTLR